MDTKFPISPAMLDMLKRAIIDQAVHTPYSHLQGYMNRWFATADDAMAYKAEDQPVRRVHEILRSDKDRDLHDHPFDYITLIMEGGYFEEQPKYADWPAGPRISTWRGEGSLLSRRAEDPHRLIIPEGSRAVTLFMTSPRRRDWGFYTKGGWVHWRNYLNIPEGLNSAGEPEIAA